MTETKKLASGCLLMAFTSVLVACSGDDSPTAGTDAADGDSTTTIAATADIDELVGIGDRSLHLVCVGAGSPTVLIELGAGDTVGDWSGTQADLGRDHRTCVYERAGIGTSDPSPEPSDAQAVSADLEALLGAAEFEGPVVLLAFSIGAIYAEHFARSHPDDVAGLVFVDPRAASYELRYRDILTPEERAEDDAFLANPGLTALPEGRAILAAPAAAQQAVEAGAFPEVPVVVLTAGVGDPEESAAGAALWQETHEALAALSPLGVERVVEGAGHRIWITDSQAIVDAVDEVVAGG